MATRNVDLLLFPHVDLHMVVTGGPNDIPLIVDVVLRTLQLDAQGADTSDPFELRSIRAGSTFTFFQPHLEAPDRFKNQPTVDPTTGRITATVPGVYLFQVVGAGGTGSLVGRLQVHTEITDWWFGNGSLTTALDPKFAHTEPSIYASFKPDPSGTDLVGDITGHNYVVLSSDDPAKVAIDQAPLPPITPPLNPARTSPRLRGKVETAAPVTIRGTFLNQTRELPVRVVNYDKVRTTLESIPHPFQDIPRANDRFNLVFLSEGFRQQDSGLFDAITRKAAADFFDKPRHEPYGMLKGSFNIFKVFEPSQDQQTTCGYFVQEKPSGLGAGAIIPAKMLLSRQPSGTYSMLELVERVGLPKQGEQRSPNDLRAFWSRQNLLTFNPGQLHLPMAEAWKFHQHDHLVQTSDTFFGLYVGARWADGSRVFALGEPPIVLGPPPIVDNAANPTIRQFINRVYDFYRVDTTVSLRLDPRRHALELYAHDNEVNPNNVVLKYLAGLRSPAAPAVAIGQNWVPSATQRKRSRGMVALVSYDAINGGQNINARSMTAVTVDAGERVALQAVPNGHPNARRRVPPPPGNKDTGIAKFDRLVNTLAHEIGHSFHLGDEYEDQSGDHPSANSASDVRFDNVAGFGAIRFGADNSPATRRFDPGKVKWFTLPRMLVSSGLAAPSVASTAVPGAIEVTVGPGEIIKWIVAFKAQAKIDLRNAAPGLTNGQLPFPSGPDQFLADLSIGRQPDLNRGSFILVPSVPLSPVPVFAKGSTVYVPLTDANSTKLVVVPPQVLAFLTDPTNPRNRRPLNLDQDNVNAKQSATDDPVAIAGFTAPRLAFRLVGLFEGANHFAGGQYRPTGSCKMRGQDGADERGEFCFVCKWLIVNLVDPGQHRALDLLYPGFPNA